jgi:predicted nucleic acid-binding protein
VNAVFVDTGVWYRFSTATDQHHAHAVEILEADQFPFVTSWPVVWETLTLISRRQGGIAASQFGQAMLAEKWARIVELQSTDYALALDFMARFDLLRLSSADATACALIRRLNLQQVASFDEHFHIVLPERIMLGRTR